MPICQVAVLGSHRTAEQCSLEVAAMSAHVPVEVPTLREPSITDLALVRLLPSVCPVMLCEGGAVCKPFATSCALIRPVP